MDFSLFVNIVLNFSILLLVSLSFSIIYYSSKIFHIANAAIITISAYTVFYFVNFQQITLFLSVFFSIILSVIMGVFFEILIYRIMRKHNAPLLSYLISSIGLYVILLNYISVFFGDETKIINTSIVVVGHQIFGAYLTTVQISTIFIAIVLFILVNCILHFTLTGKSIRAVASNPTLCDTFGINSNKSILIAFGLGSALAAVAGILSAMDTNMTPTFGFNLLLYGMVAMIIGGVGSTRGLIAGTLLVATVQNLAAYYIDSKWMDAVTYIILILFLIWKPLGFSGKRLKKVEV